VTSIRSAVLAHGKHLAERGLTLVSASRCYKLRQTTEVFPSSRNTDPRLTGTGCIDATATVAAVGAGTPGELIIGVIAKELVGTASTIDLIRAPAPAHEILAILSECLVTVRATKDGVVARAPTDDIIAAKA